MATSFEKKLEQLENIVQSLEDGTSTLDQSLKAFEKGVNLSRVCQEELDKAGKKIEILLKENGEIKGKEPFEE
ncbi:MAG: exodeoxyribonuclease VII small subunit [Proteobacteria bacterium]|nr:exodeoxyribonuclease VII small subunit [Pseudomonadota bacterium]